MSKPQLTRLLSRINPATLFVITFIILSALTFTIPESAPVTVDIITQDGHPEPTDGTIRVYPSAWLILTPESPNYENPVLVAEVEDSHAVLRLPWGSWKLTYWDEHDRLLGANYVKVESTVQGQYIRLVTLPLQIEAKLEFHDSTYPSQFLDDTVLRVELVDVEQSLPYTPTGEANMNDHGFRHKDYSQDERETVEEIIHTVPGYFSYTIERGRWYRVRVWNGPIGEGCRVLLDNFYVGYMVDEDHWDSQYRISLDAEGVSLSNRWEGRKRVFASDGGLEPGVYAEDLYDSENLRLKPGFVLTLSYEKLERLLEEYWGKHGREEEKPPKKGGGGPVGGGAGSSSASSSGGSTVDNIPVSIIGGSIDTDNSDLANDGEITVVASGNPGDSCEVTAYLDDQSDVNSVEVTSGGAPLPEKDWRTEYLEGTGELKAYATFHSPLEITVNYDGPTPDEQGLGEAGTPLWAEEDAINDCWKLYEVTSNPDGSETKDLKLIMYRDGEVHVENLDYSVQFVLPNQEVVTGVIVDPDVNIDFEILHNMADQCTWHYEYNYSGIVLDQTTEILQGATTAKVDILTENGQITPLDFTVKWKIHDDLGTPVWADTSPEGDPLKTVRLSGKRGNIEFIDMVQAGYDVRGEVIGQDCYVTMTRTLAPSEQVYVDPELPGKAEPGIISVIPPDIPETVKAIQGSFKDSEGNSHSYMIGELDGEGNILEKHGILEEGFLNINSLLLYFEQEVTAQTGNYQVHLNQLALTVIESTEKRSEIQFSYVDPAGVSFTHNLVWESGLGYIKHSAWARNDKSKQVEVEFALNVKTSEKMQWLTQGPEGDPLLLAVFSSGERFDYSDLIGSQWSVDASLWTQGLEAVGYKIHVKTTLDPGKEAEFDPTLAIGATTWTVTNDHFSVTLDDAQGGTASVWKPDGSTDVIDDTYPWGFGTGIKVGATWFFDYYEAGTTSSLLEYGQTRIRIRFQGAMEDNAHNDGNVDFDKIVTIYAHSPRIYWDIDLDYDGANPVNYTECKHVSYFDNALFDTFGYQDGGAPVSGALDGTDYLGKADWGALYDSAEGCVGLMELFNPDPSGLNDGIDIYDEANEDYLQIYKSGLVNQQINATNNDGFNAVWTAKDEDAYTEIDSAFDEENDPPSLSVSHGTLTDAYDEGQGAGIVTMTDTYAIYSIGSGSYARDKLAVQVFLQNNATITNLGVQRYDGSNYFPHFADPDLIMAGAKGGADDYAVVDQGEIGVASGQTLQMKVLEQKTGAVGLWFDDASSIGFHVYSEGSKGIVFDVTGGGEVGLRISEYYVQGSATNLVDSGGLGWDSWTFSSYFKDNGATVYKIAVLSSFNITVNTPDLISFEAEYVDDQGGTNFKDTLEYFIYSDGSTFYTVIDKDATVLGDITQSTSDGHFSLVRKLEFPNGRYSKIAVLNDTFTSLETKNIADTGEAGLEDDWGIALLYHTVATDTMGLLFKNTGNASYTHKFEYNVVSSGDPDYVQFWVDGSANKNWDANTVLNTVFVVQTANTNTYTGWNTTHWNIKGVSCTENVGTEVEEDILYRVTGDAQGYARVDPTFSFSKYPTIINLGASRDYDDVFGFDHDAGSFITSYSLYYNGTDSKYYLVYLASTSGNELAFFSKGKPDVSFGYAGNQIDGVTATLTYNWAHDSAIATSFKAGYKINAGADQVGTTDGSGQITVANLEASLAGIGTAGGDTLAGIDPADSSDSDTVLAYIDSVGASSVADEVGQEGSKFEVTLAGVHAFATNDFDLKNMRIRVTQGGNTGYSGLFTFNAGNTKILTTNSTTLPNPNTYNLAHSYTIYVEDSNGLDLLNPADPTGTFSLTASLDASLPNPIDEPGQAGVQYRYTGVDITNAGDLSFNNWYFQVTRGALSYNSGGSGVVNPTATVQVGTAGQTHPDDKGTYTDTFQLKDQAGNNVVGESGTKNFDVDGQIDKDVTSSYISPTSCNPGAAVTLYYEFANNGTSLTTIYDVGARIGAGAWSNTTDISLAVGAANQTGTLILTAPGVAGPYTVDLRLYGSDYDTHSFALTVNPASTGGAGGDEATTGGGGGGNEILLGDFVVFEIRVADASCSQRTVSFMLLIHFVSDLNYHANVDAEITVKDSEGTVLHEQTTTFWYVPDNREISEWVPVEFTLPEDYPLQDPLQLKVEVYLAGHTGKGDVKTETLTEAFTVVAPALMPSLYLLSGMFLLMLLSSSGAGLALIGKELASGLLLFGIVGLVGGYSVMAGVIHLPAWVSLPPINLTGLLSPSGFPFVIVGTIFAVLVVAVKSPKLSRTDRNLLLAGILVVSVSLLTMMGIVSNAVGSIRSFTVYMFGAAVPYVEQAGAMLYGIGTIGALSVSLGALLILYGFVSGINLKTLTRKSSESVQGRLAIFSGVVIILGGIFVAVLMATGII